MKGVFKACDIRGVAGEELTAELAYRIGRAIGVKLAGRKVVVGGDIRLSTPWLKAELIKALLESGCQVTDVGILATPVFYYALRKTGADGGVMVTASHNPGKYNGFKMVFGNMPVSEEDVAEIGRLVEENARVDGTGTLTELALIEDYLRDTSALAADGKGMKVVVDAGNGATALIAPKLFRAAGYEVVELYCEPDGHFPNRPPNPALAENLADLGRAVRQSGAQLGVAFDGDGDRVGFVDENGRPIDNDDIIVLLARAFLEHEPGTIIYDAKCSMVAAEEIVKAGGKAVMARAGHTFSKAAFLRERALFAGEISGHFFFRELNYDDGMYAGLQICQFVAEHGSLAELVDAIPNYLLTPDIRVKYVKPDKEEVLEQIALALAAYQPNRIDGVRIDFADGWGMIRASVTEPLFTLRFEAKTRQRLDEIIELLLAALPDKIRAAVLNALPPLN
ncbi:phosphomannomutase/phosphoglucomutase [Azotosporobacter soli]|uniref:phosphomannomutase/phosphoglucomutase n=1 Tax=Azotosporobacter soli TaxID=3055040 RepID=UPI0031FE93E3